MTPNDLEVLIHYYVSPAKHAREQAIAVQASIKQFLQDKIFEHDATRESGYRVTEKGERWIEMILTTPYPIHVWSDPRHG